LKDGLAPRNPSCPMCGSETEKIPTPKVIKKVVPTSNYNMPSGHPFGLKHLERLT